MYLYSQTTTEGNRCLEKIAAADGFPVDDGDGDLCRSLHGLAGVVQALLEGFPVLQQRLAAPRQLRQQGEGFDRVQTRCAGFLSNQRQ